MPARFGAGARRSLQQGKAEPGWDRTRSWLGNTQRAAGDSAGAGSAVSAPAHGAGTAGHGFASTAARLGAGGSLKGALCFQNRPGWMDSLRTRWGGGGLALLRAGVPAQLGVEELGARWEKGQDRAGEGSALLPEGPRRRLRCRGDGGQLALLLALGNRALGLNIPDLGWGAGVAAGAVVGRARGGSRGTPGCSAGPAVVSPCPRCDRAALCGRAWPQTPPGAAIASPRGNRIL